MKADLSVVCRCCLSELDDGRVKITEKVKILFYELVQAELIESDQLPDKICHKCIASLSCFSALKKTFLDNQKTLLNSIKDHFRDETPSNTVNIEFSDINSTSIKLEPERICETELIEPEINFYPASEPESDKNLKSRLCKKSFVNSSFRFESRAGFKSHYDENHRSKLTNHTCDFCGFQTANKHVLSGHVKSHIIGDRRNRTPAACDQCDAILVSAYQLQVHKKNVHQHSESFKCFCGKTYKWQRSLDYHKKYVHENATKDHECPVCHHKFNLKSSLVKHMTNLHPENGERPVHICETCGRSFSYLVALRRHRSVHLEKSFACEHCDKKFSRKENYLNHQAHHQTLPFPCLHCTRSFRINFELQKHLRRVHFKHQVKVKCELCSMWLASKETYRAHVLNKHRDVDSLVVNNLLDKIERTVPAKAPLKFLS